MRTRNDLTIYERDARDWWDDRSPSFRSLHAVHRHRFGRLLAWLEELRGTDALSGARVVDLGCGGGLLAEPLAARGARVIGCDLSGTSVAVARDHAHAAGLAAPPLYLRADLRSPPIRTGAADLVLLSDVLEHVSDPREVFASAARLLAPGGCLYVSTLNRTWRASFLAITLAEGLRLVPRGTHDARLFIRPAELTGWAAAAGLELCRIEGESPKLLQCLRTWTTHVRRSRSLAVAYSGLFRRGGLMVQPNGRG